MERSDVTSLLNTLTTSANTALTLLPFIVLFKGAFILGLFIKDKVGHLLPSRIYTEPLPHSHTFASLMYNTRDHNNVHDLVQPFNIDTDSHVVDSGPEFSSYPRHKRRLEEEAYVSDMVAVAAGSRPYSMKTEEPATLQQLVKESQPSPGFWDSFIKLK